MSSNNKSEKLLKELADLDQQLEKIKSFLQGSKTGNINDSFFTRDNILAAIDLLEKINPEERNMIYALKTMLPMAEKSNEELLKQEKEAIPISPRQLTSTDTETPADVYTQWTPKLKSKIPNNRLI